MNSRRVGIHRFTLMSKFVRRYIVAAGAVLVPVSIWAQPDQLPADWPPMPNRTMIRDDSQYVTRWGPAPLTAVYRRLYAVLFNRQAPGDSVKALLVRLNAKPIGGYWSARYYYLSVPDPGPKAADVDRILAAFRKSRTVRSADPVWVEDPVTIKPDANDRTDRLVRADVARSQLRRLGVPG
jgi:hypothetical protein